MDEAIPVAVPEHVEDWGVIDVSTDARNRHSCSGSETRVLHSLAAGYCPVLTAVVHSSSLGSVCDR